MNEEKSPLIHIGYQKAASTFLQLRIFKPEFGFYSPYAEHQPEISDRFILVNPFKFDPVTTQAFFDKKLTPAKEGSLIPVLSCEDLCGHFWRAGNYEKEVSYRIKDTYPYARIIIIVREQKDIIKSAWYHYLRRNGTQPLTRFIGERNNKGIAGGLCRLDHFKYDLLVSHYQKLFGKANVLILPLELLRTEQNNFINKVLAFAGSEANFRIERKPLHAAPKPFELLLHHVAGRVIHSDIHAKDRSFWEKALNKICLSAGKLTPPVVNKLIEKSWKEHIAMATKGYYSDSNKRLFDMIDMSLEKFGYDV